MNNGTSMVAWIALVVAILALILGWTAFNRSGENLEQIVADEVAEALNDTERAVREGTADTLEGTADVLEEGAVQADDAAVDARN